MTIFNLGRRHTAGLAAADESSSWIYDNADVRPNVANKQPTDCRSRSYPRRAGSEALFTYQALQREAAK